MLTLGRLNIIWVCPQNNSRGKDSNKMEIWNFAFCKRFRVLFTPHQTILLLKDFLQTFKVFFSVLKYFPVSFCSNISLFFHLACLLVSNPGALKEALGMESALHSLPELRMTPDRSKNFIRTDSSICLSKALLNRPVAVIIKWGFLLPLWWTLLWITKQFEGLPDLSSSRCSFPLVYMFRPDSPW